MCKSFHTLQVTTSATPESQPLRELYRTCWRFKCWILQVIVTHILVSILQRHVKGFSHAAGFTGNHIGDSGCTALAGALPHLLALQVLDLASNCFLTFWVMFCSVLCKSFHTLQGTTSANPESQPLRELYRTCLRFKCWILQTTQVIVSCNFHFVLQRGVQEFSHAAGNNIGDSGITALAGALPHLLALQVLNLANYTSNCFLIFFILFCSVVCNEFHTLQVTTSAPPESQPLRELYRTCWRFKCWDSHVIVSLHFAFCITAWCAMNFTRCR
jgi:hypothetical protein